MAFKDWFEAAQKRAGLSDQGFSDRAAYLGYSISKSGVRNWRVGTQPDPESCQLIAAVLGFPLAMVLHEAGHPADPPTGPDGVPLEADEAQLLAAYKALPQFFRQAAIGAVLGLLGSVPESMKEAGQAGDRAGSRRAGQGAM